MITKLESAKVGRYEWFLNCLPISGLIKCLLSETSTIGTVIRLQCGRSRTELGGLKSILPAVRAINSVIGWMAVG